MANKETYIIEQKLTTDNSSFISGNKEAKSSANDLSGAVSGVKTKMKSLLSPTNLAAAAVGVMAYQTVQAVKNFAAYEKQLSSLNTLLKVSKTELNNYGDGLVDIAIKTGVAKEALADGAYQALSSGVDPAELLEFMETAAEGATVGMTDVATATDTLTSTLNGFKLESSDATDTMDKLITIQNNGKVVLGQLSTVMGDVADMSYNLGLDLDNVGAAISTITMNGTPAAQAGTRLKAMFSELSKEGTTAYDTFQMITGESFKEFIEKGGNLGEAMQEMQEYAEANGKEMIDLWSSIEAGQGAMGITGSNAETFTKNLDAMKDSAGELEESFGIASDNIETEWKKLTETLSGKWDDLVENMRDPIIVTLKVIRKGLGGETDDDLREEATKSLTESESKIAELQQEAAELEAQIAESEKNPTWWSEKGWGGTDSLKIKLANIQEAIKTATWEYEKASNDIAALDAKNAETVTEKKSGDDNSGGSDNGGSGNGEDPDEIKERLDEIEAYEKAHADNMTQIDIEALNSRKDYQESLNEQLEAGLISREEYNDKLEAFEDQTELEQKEQYVSALEELKSFYESVGELTKANEIEKQILEIEVQITGMEGDLLDGGLTAFQEAQTKAAELYHNTLLAGEYEFQQEKLALLSSGAISEQEYTQSLFDYRQNMNTLENEFNIQQLEELKAYQAEKLGDLAAAAETQREIEEARLEDSNQIKELELQNEEDYSNTISDLKQGVVEVFAETASDILSGEIESLNDLASVLLERLGTLALGEAEQALVRAYVDYAKATSYAADPLTASLAPPLYAAASQEVALASQLGAIGAVSMAASSAFSTDDDDSDSDYDYDDDDVSTTEDTASDSDDDSTTIYVNVDDSTMAKNMIAILEDELNDEYNVSIIGKKK
ncbi:phage tail tape measure protein [uncultured Ilyobacter sp.]|uniref:phage tail tape measure protein n=1 Tax=uncultured Ilyobacter sp. TaxID=544433 RepID=UPI0029C065F1|nr:phage tail tape measure protein [uncultured Ilyobacter sp.]